MQLKEHFKNIFYAYKYIFSNYDSTINFIGLEMFQSYIRLRCRLNRIILIIKMFMQFLKSIAQKAKIKQSLRFFISTY